MQLREWSTQHWQGALGWHLRLIGQLWSNLGGGRRAELTILLQMLRYLAFHKLQLRLKGFGILRRGRLVISVSSGLMHLVQH